jgi:hypothetical protein
MEAAGCSKMLVPIYQMTWCHFPGDHPLKLLLNCSNRLDLCCGGTWFELHLG